MREINKDAIPGGANPTQVHRIENDGMSARRGEKVEGLLSEGKIMLVENCSTKLGDCTGMIDVEGEEYLAIDEEGKACPCFFDFQFGKIQVP